MKILLAINSEDHKNLADRALRWCGRLGFDFKVFVDKNKRRRFAHVIADANYHYYLALSPDILVGRTTAKDYARQHEYDLLVTVPEELLSWRKGRQFKQNEIKQAYEAISSMRGRFSENPKKRIHRWHNGVVMERITQ